MACEDGISENWFEQQFASALKDLRPQASVGFGPMAAYGADVGTALLHDPVTGFDPSRVETLKQFVRMRLDNPRQADPILSFIKPEPHSEAKLADNRLRLISAVGFVDTMVDRVCFGPFARRVLATVGRTPVLIGWSPYQGGYRHLLAQFCGKPALCLDRSGWDWSMPPWLLFVVRDLLHDLAVGAPKWWHEWLDVRWEVLFRDAVFGTRDGFRVQQPGWGVMKSGCYLTILINSVAQVAMHLLACRRLSLDPRLDQFFVMGDDTIQKTLGKDLDAYIGELEAMGAILKAPHVSSEYEFCGHRFGSYWMRPAYVPKHVFRIVTAAPEELPELLAAYHWVYVHDPDMWAWLTRGLRKVAPDRCLTLREAHSLIHGT